MVGRLLLLNFFLNSDLLTHHGQSPPRRKPSKTNLPKATSVCSAHLRKYSPLIHRTTKRMIPVTMSKVSVPRTTMALKMTLMTLKTERKRKILLQIGGTPVVPFIDQSLEVSCDKHERTDID